MIYQFSVGAAVSAIANFHAAEDAMGPLSMEGPFLTFDFGSRSLEESLAAIKIMDEFVGLQIAESDGGGVTHALSALKHTIVGLENELRRDYMIRERAQPPVMTEATIDLSVSRLHANQHTATSETSQQSSNAKQNEENGNEAQQQEQPPRRRSNRRG